MEEAEFPWADTQAITDNIEDFVAALPENPVLTVLKVIAKYEDKTYREIAVKDSKRFKILYRLRTDSDVIEIIYVRSTAQNVKVETLISELEAGSR
jgi:hypothetical protein